MKRVIYTDKVRRGFRQLQMLGSAAAADFLTDEDKRAAEAAEIYAALEWIRYQEWLRDPKRQPGT
jgi:hypothetical protein